MAEKKEYQIWNRGNNYYDDILAQIMFGKTYPRGTSERKKVGGEWQDVPIDPLYQGPNARKTGRMEASLKEDEALRGALGGSRKMGKGEKLPQGAYALANYPGLQSAVDWAATGNLPGGSASIGMWLKEQSDMGLRHENAQKRREWAMAQKQLLGGGNASIW